jgi:hypothetical protein
MRVIRFFLAIVLLVGSLSPASACEYWDCTLGENYAACWIRVQQTGNYSMTCRTKCDLGVCWCEYVTPCFIG